MERNNRRNDENWLAPVTQELYEKFLKEVAGLIYFDNREECYNVASIPYFVARGHFCKNMDDRHGTLCLGEYGPIMRENGVNFGTDFDTLLSLDKLHPVQKEIYTQWIKLVAKANKGRLIGGKDFLTTLKEEMKQYIINQRDLAIATEMARASVRTKALNKLIGEASQEEGIQNQ